MADTTPIEGEIVRNELAVILDEQGVSPESQKTLVEAFGGPFNEVGDILAKYQEIVITDGHTRTVFGRYCDLLFTTPQWDMPSVERMRWARWAVEPRKSIEA